MCGSERIAKGECKTAAEKTAAEKLLSRCGAGEVKVKTRDVVLVSGKTQRAECVRNARRQA